jgi:hypothetical protein
MMVDKTNAIPFPAAKNITGFRSSPKWRCLRFVCALMMLSSFTSAQSQANSIPRNGYITWAHCETPNYAGSHFSTGLSDLGYKPGENKKRVW